MPSHYIYSQPQHLRGMFSIDLILVHIYSLSEFKCNTVDQNKQTVDALGAYSQHFISFITFKWAQYDSVLHNAMLKCLPVTNILAYWVHLSVAKKMKCSKYNC